MRGSGRHDPHAGSDAAGYSRPTNKTSPESRYNEGDGKIILLYPMDGTGTPDGTQWGGLVNNGNAGIETKQVNGDAILWTRDQAGEAGALVTSCFRLYNNQQPVTDWLPISLRSSRANPISPNGVLTVQQGYEMYLMGQPLYCLPFSRVDISVGAGIRVQALIFKGRATAL